MIIEILKNLKIQLGIKVYGICLIVFLANTIQAESLVVKPNQEKISGTVTDANGGGLPGVSILIVGTTIGTTTDVNGKFSLAAGSDATLRFSYIGYKTQEIEVENQTILNVQLETDLEQLEEIVVIGYGTQKKSDLTAAIASIDGDDIKQFPVADVPNALQGLAAGVEVYKENGAPGGTSKIRIRGVGSINNSSDPIVVIDGVIGDMNTVNPSDIKSIEVLKDAAYAAVYGARAANGVILVTTNKGTSGRTKISLNAFGGVRNPWKKPQPLGRDDYAMIVNELHQNAGSEAPDVIKDIMANPSNYPDGNFVDEVFQTGYFQKYELSVSGGGENSSFYFSGGYYDEKGTIIETDHDRYNLRLNSTFDLGKLTIGENLGLVYQNTNGFTPKRPKNNMILRESVWMIPTVPAYDPSTSHGYGSVPGDYGADPYNYVAVMELSDYVEQKLDITGNIFAEYKFFEGFKYRLNLGIDYGNPYQLYHMRPYLVDQQWYDENNYIENETRRSTRVIIENILSYEKTLGDHNFNLLAGYTQERFKSDRFDAGGQGAFASDEISTLDQLLGDNISIGGTKTAWNLASYLGRFSYGYKGRYLLTALVRRDGSSKFGPQEKWGVFPSISAAWRLSDEPFMNLDWLSNAKIRTSYGKLGRLPNNNFGYVARLRNRPRTGFGNEVAVGATEKGSFANEALKWETETQTNIGVDLGFLNDKITFTADYYNRNTDDMLIEQPLPLSSGYDQSDVNVGSMRNSGFEFSLSYQNNIGEFNYGISGNLSLYDNKVLDIGGEDAFIAGGSPKQHPAGNTTRTEEGQPLASFYGLQAIGIYQDESEIDETFAPNAVPGDVKFADLNGDGELTDEDLTFIGNPYPDLTYGFNLNFGYKGFDLSGQFYGVQGIDVFNSNLYQWRAGYRNFNQTSDILNRWTPGSGQNKWPRVVLSDPANNWRASDLYIEDASYFRMRLATLGYTFSNRIAESIGLGRLRIYVQSQNLFTITNYSGMDPEVPGDEGTLGRGVDEGDNYPSPRSFIGGIQIDF